MAASPSALPPSVLMLLHRLPGALRRALEGGPIESELSPLLYRIEEAVIREAQSPDSGGLSR